MTDDEFIAGFEAGTLSGEQFHHRDHIKAAWLFLNRYPAIEALQQFSTCLRRFAAAHGKPNLYHTTITWGFVLLINERRERAGRVQSWEQFAAANPDLFDWRNNILKTYYDPTTLGSDLARNTFVFPDRVTASPA